MMAKPNVAGELVEAMAEMLAIVKGEAEPAAAHHVAVEAPLDVRTIRAGLGLTREEFGRRFGFPPRTVQEWEQGRRRPDAATRAYLTVIKREPAAVLRALSAE